MGPSWGSAAATVLGPCTPPQPALSSASLPRLTLIAELEANVRVTLVGREEEIEVVAGADEELGNLGPVVNPDQGC